MIAKQREYGVDLEATTGTKLHELPLPGTLPFSSSGIDLGHHPWSFDLGTAPPILSGTDNRNGLNCLHIEKIVIDADQERAFTGNRSAQYRYVGRISANVWRQIGRLHNNANSTEEDADLIRIAPRKIEFFDELSPQFVEDKVGNHQFMGSKISSSISAHTPARLMCAAMSTDESSAILTSS